MKPASRFVLFAVLFVLGASLAAGAEKAPKMLCHDVYFTLKDNSPKATESLVAGCKKFLSEHPGIIWFAAGALVREHERDVNDRDFDVALHIVFKDKAAHDKYQQADAHHKFIEEYEDNWESARVFDSWLTVTAHGEDQTHDAHEADAHSHDTDAHEHAGEVPAHDTQGHDHAEEAPAHDHEAAEHTHEHADADVSPKDLRLPDPAAHFAGMIAGTVAAQSDRGVVVNVQKVLKTWRASKAKDPAALVGKKVHVIVKSDGRYGDVVRKFVRSLKAGERVELDVAHREGEVLVILELTEEQRRRATD